MARARSIHNTLALALWGTTLLALLVGVALLGAFEHLTLEGRARRAIEPYAELVAVGAEAAVVFQDPERAQQVLGALRANPNLIEASIVLADGHPLAAYRSPLAGTVAPAERPHDDDAPGLHLGETTARLVEKLDSGASLHLTLSLEPIRQQTRQLEWAFAGAAAVLLALTLVLLFILQRAIVQPIAALTEAAERVRTGADYRQEVPDSGSDEVARLGRAFNAMLQTVRTREEDLRQLTRSQRALLDNAAYGIVSVTPDGTITTFNRAAEQLFGYGADEVIGTRAVERWHDPAEVAARAEALSAELGVPIAPGLDVFQARPRRDLPEEREWTIIRRDGSRVPVLISLTALRDEGGEVTGYMALTYDLTARKEAEAELVRLNQELDRRVRDRTAQLEAANKELESFAYSVSHDLRAPLRAIDGFSQMVVQEHGPALDATAQRHLGLVRSNVQRMAQLIDDILRLSRVGRAEMRMEEVDLSAMAREIIGELAQREPGRVVDVSIADGLHVVADARLLRVAMENLLGNAWKFTGRKGEAHIELGQREEGGSPTFYVRDDGAGFEMGQAHHLFTAFQRLHSTSEFPGTGIGLATVQRIIARHGGRVWAEGRVGEGATFYFKLR